ncbi:hypothetical protein BC830DRAFT_549582 [Chytriomyces sp. MP71]|nr:hypothetical protein BC830DRAFT_549582 [Chytriomyces sp. MP71]
MTSIQLARLAAMHLGEVASLSKPFQHLMSQAEAANSPSALPSSDCPPFLDLCASTLPSTTSPHSFYCSFFYLFSPDLAQWPEQLLLYFNL